MNKIVEVLLDQHVSHKGKTQNSNNKSESSAIPDAPSDADSEDDEDDEDTDTNNNINNNYNDNNDTNNNQNNQNNQANINNNSKETSLQSSFAHVTEDNNSFLWTTFFMILGKLALRLVFIINVIEILTHSQVERVDHLEMNPNAKRVRASNDPSITLMNSLTHLFGILNKLIGKKTYSK